MKENTNFLERLKQISKNKKVLYVLSGIIIIIVGVFFASGGKNALARDMLTVESKNIEKTVLASGKVISATDLGLSFQTNDIVRSINVSLGDKVKKGQIIATLVNNSQNADLTRARGQLLGAEAKYRKVIEGANGVDIAAAEAALASAQKTQDKLVENARRTLLSSDLIAEAQRADMNPLSNPVIGGTYLGQSEGVYNLYVEQSTSIISFNGIEKGQVATLSLQRPLGVNGLTISFPTNTYATNDEWRIEIPNKNGRNYTANLNAYNAALATREEVLSAAKFRIDSLKAQTRGSDIDSAGADVLVAKGGVQSAEAALEKTIMRAPLDGTITKIDIKLGDLATANKPVITLQDVGNLYVESNVSESNIIGVEIGQPVEITFEAFGKEKIYQGELSLVDLGPTSNESVVNYKVRSILRDPVNVRPGMTADLKIVTAGVKNVISVPTRYISEEGSDKFVFIVTDDKLLTTEKRAVILGIKGDGGVVEVKTGLSVGEKIAIVDPVK